MTKEKQQKGHMPVFCCTPSCFYLTLNFLLETCKKLTKLLNNQNILCVYLQKCHFNYPCRRDRNEYFSLMNSWEN